MKSIPSRMLVPAALALAAAGACAQSTVTVYGSVGAQLVYATGINKVKKVEPNSIVTPRLGFKGGEDLGGGLKAFFTLESEIKPDTGGSSTPFWGRGSYVGVGGGFGSVSIGRQWNLNDDLLCGLYVCGGYAAFYNLPGFGNSSDLVDNAIKYTLPSIEGVAGGLMVAPSEGIGRYTAVAGTYTFGPFVGGLGYDQRRGTSGKNDTLLLLAGKYDFGPGFVRAAYADSKAEASGLGKATAYDLGVGYKPTAETELSLDYVAMDRKNSPDDASFVRLVGIYNLSKRTSLNANIIQLSNKGASAVALAGAAVAPGKSQTIVTAGIAHNF